MAVECAWDFHPQNSANKPCHFPHQSVEDSDCTITSTKEVTFFIGASLFFFVSMITQKLLNRLIKNRVERWHTGQGRNDYILVVIRITLL